jgi:hypothetical protein
MAKNHNKFYRIIVGLKNQTLTELNLDAEELTQDDIAALNDALRGNISIKHISLRNNKLTKIAIEPTLAILGSKTYPIKINLEGNDITPAELPRLYSTNLTIQYAESLQEDIPSLTQFDLQEYGELFAQIQADSDIRGTPFEGNIIPDVFKQMNMLLQDISGNPLSGYIDNTNYLDASELYRDVSNQLYLLQSKDLNVDELYKTFVNNNNRLVVPCGFEKHAIVVEFELRGDILSIAVYNTGLGSRNHELELKNGKKRHRSCVRYNIKLKDPAIEAYGKQIPSILELISPEGLASDIYGREIQKFYDELQSICSMYPGSSIDHNDSTLIIGQRSGTCVWKSMFRFVREHVKKINPGHDIELLIKYDIKIRTLLALKQQLKDPNKIKITRQLIDIIRFSCENNTRLAKKLYERKIITATNLQAGLLLFDEVLEMLPGLESRIIDNLKFDEMISKVRSGGNIIKPKPDTSETTTREFIPLTHRLETDFPITEVDDLNAAIQKLLTNIGANQYEDDEYLRSLVEYAILQSSKIIEYADDQNIHLEYLKKMQSLLDEYSKILIKSRECYDNETRMLIIVKSLLTSLKIFKKYATLEKLRPWMYGIYQILNMQLLANPHNAELYRELVAEYKSLSNGCKLEGFDPYMNMHIYESNASANAYLSELDTSLPNTGLEIFIQLSKVFRACCNISLLSKNTRKLEDYNSEILVMKERFSDSTTKIETAESLRSCIDKKKPIYLQSVHVETEAVTPEDIFILRNVDKIYSRGLLELYKYKSIYCPFNSSANAYLPHGKNVKVEDVVASQLQSIFAEKTISFSRLEDFLRRHVLEFTDQKYIDILNIRIFTNDAIGVQLAINPKNILSFIQSLQEILTMQYDSFDSISPRSIFPISIFYLSAWYILKSANCCKDLESYNTIKSYIASCNNLDIIDIKLRAIEDKGLQSTQQYFDLIYYKILHYQIQQELNGEISASQVLDVLQSLVRLTLSPASNRLLRNITQVFKNNILEKLSADFMAQNGKMLAENILKVVGDESRDFSEIVFDENQKILSFLSGGTKYTYYMQSNILSISGKELGIIPEKFRDNSYFKDIFTPLPTHCLVLDENAISFKYKGYNYFVKYTSFGIHIKRDEGQLYMVANQQDNVYVKLELPITLLDKQFCIYNSEDADYIADKQTQLDLYKILWAEPVVVTRLADAAKLINLSGEPFDSIMYFEHKAFIECWELTNGKIQICLRRYGITIEYFPENPKSLLLKSATFQGNYELLESPKYKQTVPDGLNLIDANGQILTLLPVQHFIARPKEIEAEDEFTPIIFDKYAAVHLFKDTNCAYFDAIKNPQNVTLGNSANFILLKEDKRSLICNNAKEYYYLAYYLIGRGKLELAMICLQKGSAINSQANSMVALKWLFAIINESPVELKSISLRVGKVKQLDSKRIGLLIRASYQYLKEQNTKYLKQTDVIRILELLQIYIENFNNVPLNFRLSRVEEFELIGTIAAFPISKNYSLMARLNWIKANLDRVGHYETKDIVRQYRCNDSTISMQLSIPNDNNYRVYVNTQAYQEIKFDRKSIYKTIANLTLDEISSIYFVKFVKYIATTPMTDAILLELKIRLTKLLSAAEDPAHNSEYSINNKQQQRDLVKWLLYLMKKCEDDPTYGIAMEKLLLQCIGNKAVFSISEFLKLLLAKDFSGVQSNDIAFSFDMTEINFLEYSENIIHAIDGSLYSDHSDKTVKPEFNVNLQDLMDRYSVANLSEDICEIKVDESETPQWLAGVEKSRVRHRDDYIAGVRANSIARSNLIRQVARNNFVKDEDKIVALRDKIRQLEDVIYQKFNITENLEQQALRLSGIKPELTIQKILRIFLQQEPKIFLDNSFMNFAQASEVNQLLFEYLFAYTELQALERNEPIAPRAYLKETDLRLIATCLLIEKESNIRVYEQQLVNIKHIINQDQTPNAIIQMAMGQGKTRVMAPIIAMLNANGNDLSLYIVPDALFESTVNDIRNTSATVFGKIPIAINFSREQKNLINLEVIYIKLLAAIQDRNFVVMTPATIHALYLTRRECRLRLDEVQNEDEISELQQCADLLDNIFFIFKKSGVCTIDEIDQVLNIEVEYNYASIEHKSITAKFPNLLKIMQDFYAVLKIVPLPATSYQNMYVHDIIIGKARKPTVTEWSTIQQDIAEAIYSHYLYRLNIDKDKAILCLLGKADLKEVGFNLTEADKDMLATFKFQLADLLKFTLDAAYLEEYGAKQVDPLNFSDVLAIPRYQQVPIVGSEFSDQLTTLNFTILSFLNLNTAISSEVLTTFFNDFKLRYNAANQEKRLTLILELVDLLDISKERFKLALLNDPDFINEISIKSKTNTKLKEYLLNKYILPNISESDYELESHSFTFNSIFKCLSGFSGTLENIKTFDPQMSFANQDQSLGTDGAVLDLIISMEPVVRLAKKGIVKGSSYFHF